MPNPEIKAFPAGEFFESGIDNYNPDFTARIALNDTSYNTSSGINRGLGPRYGMSPIPGQSNNEVVSAAPHLIDDQRGLRASEAAGDEDTQFVNRQKFLGIVPLTVGSYDDLTVKGKTFLWLLSDFENATTEPLSAVPNTERFIVTGEMKYSFELLYGFPNNMWAQMKDTGQLSGYMSPLIRTIGYGNTSTLTPEEFTRDFLSLNPDVFYCSSATLAVSGQKIPMQWTHGIKVNDGTATETATANFWVRATGTTYPMGISPSWNIGDFKKNNRDLVFFNLGFVNTGVIGYRLIQKYVYSNYQVTSGTFVPAFNCDTSVSNYNLSGASSLQILNDAGSPFNAPEVGSVLMFDPDGFCDSSYRAVLVAAKKPYAFIIQDWLRDSVGRNVQTVSLIDRLHKPKCVTTIAYPPDTPSYYCEDGCQVSSCFSFWPNYDGSALPKVSSLTMTAPGRHVALGDAGSGILRANTIYEFTFSVYDKQFGVETNVGEPATFMTGNDDFVALSLYIDQQTAGGEWKQLVPVAATDIIIDEQYWTVDGAPTDNPAWANYLEFRFYYREVGTNEWLPALFIDAAKFWYYPDHQILWACQGDAIGVPGGQPGGFTDYSFLPDDQYTCTLYYKGRAFWLSQNNLVFSLQNNPFAYPLRNSAPAPTGGYKGAIVHTYRGQSEQESRLVIFGEKETYIGKFTGIMFQQSVAVSPGVIAEFDVDGSDFKVETWTSITAFSHRSAVVADGDLYWWGPQGIYLDDGVGNPRKISDRLEPDIFDLYDQALTDEIHCIFDEKTKEIIWFYPPVDDNTITHAIVYNVGTGQFFLDRFDCKIDWATRIDTSNPGVTTKTCGLRTILGIRKDATEKIQRGVFFDQINRAGDYTPGKELLVKTVADGSSPRRKLLTLDNGFDPTNFATIAVGDYIAIQQYERYTRTTLENMITKVTATDVNAGTIEVLYPDGVTWPNYTPVNSHAYFPIWHAANAGGGVMAQGLNGIPYVIESKYWMPAGVNFFLFWLYWYGFFKYESWAKIDPASFLLGYKTPSGGPMTEDRCYFADNSDSNFQIYHPLRLVEPTTGAHSGGQAIKFKMSGVHIGDEWVLQYLQMDATEEAGQVLKMYEG